MQSNLSKKIQPVILHLDEELSYMVNIKAWLGLENYVSEVDQFLKEFDRQHPQLSTSQQQEVDKYKRIYAIRDNPSYHEPKDPFGDQF